MRRIGATCDNSIDAGPTLDDGGTAPSPRSTQHGHAVEVELRDGTRISFPFAPYDVQRAYMTSVVQALNSQQHALLESPTGTGKTLCLLCATLGWMVQLREAQPTRRPRVIYTSRTHAQLAQVVREFQKTIYSEHCTMAVLGSREHLCVRTNVRQLPTAHARNSTCNRLRANRECSFGNGVSEYLAQQERDRGAGGATALMDIEELVREGRRSGFCPYFYEREVARSADIVFMPYSYVLDKSLKAQTLELLASDEVVLIVDEAHNVASNISSSASCNLTAGDLSAAVSEAGMCCSRVELELREEIDAQRRAELEQAAEHYAILKLVLSNLENEIALLPMVSTVSKSNMSGPIGASPGHSSEAVHPGSMIFTILGSDGVRINSDTVGEIQKILTSAIAFVAGTDAGGRGLVQFQEFLSGVFDADLEVADIDLIYRCVVLASRERGGAVYQSRARPPSAPSVAAERRTLGFWCLDTAIAMRKIAEPFSVILMTSGTLSPMDHFAAELGLNFAVQHQGKHVVSNEQLFGSILCRSPSGGALNSSFEHRTSEEYRTQLGMSIVNVARNVPGGMLVFFPSYTSMNQALELWKAGPTMGCATSVGAADKGSGVTVWGLLSDVKPIFVEPRDSSELPQIVHEYQQRCDDRRGAVLLAVARGKVGEGVDFADRHGRCVFVTGIPFANSSDLLVRLKREYLTHVAPSRPKVRGRPFTGDDWYRNEAMRAVNQCVGRVIRHIDDFGAVVLGDERFCNLKDALSPWIGSVLRVDPEFREAYVGITRFFANHARREAGELQRKRQRLQWAPGVGTSRSSSISNGAAAFMAGLETHGCVPDAAADARRFQVDADASRETQEKGESLQQINQLPMASYLHQRVALETDPRLVFKRATFPVQPRASSSHSVCGTTHSISDVAAVPAPSSATETPSLSSKAFCEGLKQRLTPAQYRRFADALRSIAKLAASGKGMAAANDGSRDSRVAEFEAHVAALRAVFVEGLHDKVPDAHSTLVAFGAYVPASWRGHFYSIMAKEAGR